MPDCICLRDLCGDRYRVTHDESYGAERGEFRATEERWLQLVPCQSGHIFPHGGDLLAYSTDRRGSLAVRLRALPFVDVIQDGSDGITVTFPADRLDDIAAIVHPRKRRVLSEDQRARLAAIGAKSRFPSRHGTQTAGDTAERAPTVQVGKSTAPWTEREKHTQNHRVIAGFSTTHAEMPIDTN